MQYGSQRPNNSFIVPAAIAIGAGSVVGGAAGGDQGNKGKGGLQAPGPFTPYTTSTGLQPGTVPDESNQWWWKTGLQGTPNYLAPGYPEQTWWGNKPQWGQLADKTQSYWNRAAPALEGEQQGEQLAYDAANSIGTGGVSGPDNSQNFYNSLRYRTPDINENADLDPYYAAAKARMTAGINQDAAARGTWGASTTGDQVRNAMVDLEAERARAEADYRLQALAERRAWETLGSQAAGQADTSAVDRYSAGVTGARTVGELGLSADRAEQDRIAAGLQGYIDVADTTGGALAAEEGAARLAQQDAYERTQTYLNAQTGLGAQLDAIYGEGFSDLIQNDQDLQNMQIAIQLMQDANWVSYISGSGQKMLSEAQGLITTYQMLQGMGGSGGASASTGAAGSVPGAGTTVQNGMIVPY